MNKIALASALVLVSSALVPAQCYPWSKYGMRRVRDWAPGSTLEVGSAEQGSAAIALRFRYDAACHAVLESIGHRGTRPDGTVTRLDYVTEPPAGCPKGLWKAVFRPETSQDPVDLFPDAAGRFDLWVDSRNATHSAILRWSDLELPNQNCDSIFWMEVRVDVCGDKATWNSRMGRIQHPSCTDRFTLDEVYAPVVYTRQPSSGALSRILVPTASGFVTPGENLPMRLWQLVNYDLELEHPGRGQQMQFSAIFSGDPTDLPNGNHVVSSYRKVLFFGTEDTRGYYKRFLHKVVDDGGVLHYRWTHGYFPTYGPTRFINFHRSRYPVVMAAIEAKSDSYWFDVCERYREFTDHCMGLTRIDSPRYRINRDFVNASVFAATSTIDNVVGDLPPVYSTFVDAAENFRDLFTGADGTPTPMFMEWQKWLKGSPNDQPIPGRPLEDPIGPDYNMKPFSGADEAYQEPPLFVRNQIDRARTSGINLSVYTLPLVLNGSDWSTFRDEWFLRERDGGYYPIFDGAPGQWVDYGNFAVPFWMARNLFDQILDTVPSMGGLFLDVFSGGGAFLRYPSDPGLLFKKRYHGGTSFVRGTIIAIELIRARIGRNKPTNSHPDVPFIASETVQEFLAGRYDFAQHGVKAVPHQMGHNKLFDQLSGTPSVSPEISNPSPPLWHAVYHEYSRGEGLTVPLTNVGVAGVLGGGQFNPAFPGMTYQRWGDYMRMVHALWFSQGMKPLSFQYLYGLEPFNLLERRNGQVETRDPGVAQQQELVEFLQRLHRAIDRTSEGGQFLVGGRMERPLQIPDGFNPASITQSTTPSFDAEAFTDPSVPGVKHFYENFFTTQPYAMPHVLQMVWSTTGRNPKLGIVFVNWTDLPAAFQGTFDPSLYDCVGDTFTVKGIEPDGAGSNEYTIGTATGPTTLAWNPGASGLILRHHGEANPGFMPPRSVQVITIQ